MQTDKPGSTNNDSNNTGFDEAIEILELDKDLILLHPSFQH
jgi:hypothetical protein